MILSKRVLLPSVTNKLHHSSPSTETLTIEILSFTIVKLSRVFKIDATQCSSLIGWKDHGVSINLKTFKRLLLGLNFRKMLTFYALKIHVRFFKPILVHVMIHFLVPKWANWSEWSDCSMTCNSGIRTRSKACQKVDWRDADLPMPSNRYTAGNGS